MAAVWHSSHPPGGGIFLHAVNIAQPLTYRVQQRIIPSNAVFMGAPCINNFFKNITGASYHNLYLNLITTLKLVKKYIHLYLNPVPMFNQVVRCHISACGNMIQIILV
jgi:hypothetical protein